MEQLENFGPHDVQNGKLTQMFRNAGIDDVHSYVHDIRQENIELNNQSIHSVQSNRLDGFLNNAQSILNKHGNGKNGLNNVKQMYKMVNKTKSFIHLFIDCFVFFSSYFSINH